MKEAIPVFIVDDHQVVREGILSLIRENQRFQVVGEAGNGKEALTLIEELQEKPRVVLMDINMPVMDGITCTENLHKIYAGQIKVLVLSMVKQSIHIRKMLQAGASGYILKNCDKVELYQAIEAVNQDQTYFSQDVSNEVMNEMVKAKSANHTPAVVLSKREKEVLNLIVKDMSNQEIADKLHISIRTVESHKQNLISKTATNNVAGLVVFAIKNKLVQIE